MKYRKCVIIIGGRVQQNVSLWVREEGGVPTNVIIMGTAGGQQKKRVREGGGGSVTNSNDYYERHPPLPTNLIIL